MDDTSVLKYDDKFNEILIDYYKYIENTLRLTDNKSKEFIFYIVELLDLKKEIININFDPNLECSGYYNYYNKELMINFDEMMTFYKLNIIDKYMLIIEYLTALLHEIVHAIQYKHLYDYNDTLIAKMKYMSNQLKTILNDNIALHSFFPDEREASIEGSKLLYKFAEKNDLCSYEEMQTNLIYYLADGYLKSNNGMNINPISKLYNNKTKHVISKYKNIITLSDYEKLLYGFELDDSLQDKLEICKINQTIDLSLKKILKL